MKIAYVFFNGELLGSTNFYLERIKKNQGEVYCADGGALLLEKLNLFPKEIWGDFDSVSDDILKKYEENGVIIKRFPKDKDFTDGELILQYLSEKNYDKIIIIGGLGGRKDHELTNLNLMFKFKKITFLTETEEIFRIDKEISFFNLEGKTVSFIPFSTKVEGLTLEGFKYPLRDYTLYQGDSICMSNIIISNKSRVYFSEGKLLGVIVQ